MLSDKDVAVIYLEHPEKIILLTELRSIFMIAKGSGCKKLRDQYPKLCELKDKLDIFHCIDGA